MPRESAVVESAVVGLCDEGKDYCLTLSCWLLIRLRLVETGWGRLRKFESAIVFEGSATESTRKDETWWCSASSSNSGLHWGPCVRLGKAAVTALDTSTPLHLELGPSVHIHLSSVPSLADIQTGV